MLVRDNNIMISTSYYLVKNTKPGCLLKKNAKASFAKELIDQLPIECRHVHSSVGMVVIDLMAF